MGPRILAPLIATTAIIASLAAAGTAVAAQSGLTGDPWIDQYIEQVPTAGGGKPTNRSVRPRSGLSRSEVSTLARAGGDGFAYAVAATVAPLPTEAKGGAGARRGKTAGDFERRSTSQDAAAAIAQAFSGSGGGLGPVFPLTLIGVALAGIALGISRLRGADHGGSRGQG